MAQIELTDNIHGKKKTDEKQAIAAGSADWS